MALPTTPPPTMATSQVSLMFALAGEAGFHQAAHARATGEEGAGERCLFQLLAVQIDRRAGNIKRGQVLAAEFHRRRPRDRHVDDPIDPAIGTVAGDTPSVPLARPHAALGVHCHAIGHALSLGHGGEQVAGPDLARGRVDVVAIDLVGVAVGEITDTPVRTEGRAVRADEIAVDLSDLALGPHAIKDPDRPRLLAVAHAGPKIALAI